MPPVYTSTARGQKRKRSPKVDPESTPPPEPQWKRAGFRSAEEANTAFWDNLSRVPLCPPALRELDRRNWLSVGPTIKSVARSARRTTRSATRRAARVNQLNQRNSVLKDRAAQLKRFARRGGPDLHDLRGYPEPFEASLTMPPKKNPYRTPSASDQFTQKPGRTSAYNPAFQQSLIDHGVYPSAYRHLDGRRPPKPDNWGNFQQMMTQPRPSLSPSRFSDEAFETYVDQHTESLTEKKVLGKCFYTLQGDTNIPFQEDLSFGHLAPLTDGSIVSPKPDYYEGARPEQLNRKIRTELGGYVVPSTNHCAPIVPNFFTQGKGPSGNMAVADRQACYDGAMGARAMQRLQSYGQPEPVYDNNAYTIASTFDGRLLQIYTTHLTAPSKPGGQPEYHMTKYNGWDMTGNPETFRQGATAYRNGRDLAEKWRNQFIDDANKRVPQDMSFESSGYSELSTLTDRAAAPESDTSADELTSDHVTTTPHSGKRVKRGPPESSRKYRGGRDRLRR